MDGRSFVAGIVCIEATCANDPMTPYLAFDWTSRRQRSDSAHHLRQRRATQLGRWASGVASCAFGLKQKVADLLDHFVRTEQNRLRDGDAERLRGFHVDHQLEFGRLANWHIARGRAMHHFLDVGGGVAVGGS